MSNWPPSEPSPWSAQPSGSYPQPGGQGPSGPEYPGYPPAYPPNPSAPLTPGYPPPPAYGSQPFSGPQGPAYGGPAQPSVPLTPAMPYTPVVAYAPVVPVAQPDPGSGLAVAGMVLGIIGLFLFWFPACFLGLPLAVLGTIFSGVGMRSKTRRGMAVAGLVCSILTMLLSVGFIFIAALGASSSAHP